MDDDLIIGARRFSSRLLLGTGKYKDLHQTKLAVEASGAADHYGCDPPHQHRPDAG